MKRREFLAASTVVPLSIIITDIKPMSVPIAKPAHMDAIQGTMAFYAHVRLTGKEIYNIKDDIELMAFIKQQADKTAKALYNHIVASITKPNSLVGQTARDIIGSEDA